MRKPNLFIVGAPKCGTSALHYYLSQHPDIYMSEPKEPNYFGSLVKSYAETDEQYFDYAFSAWRGEKVAGEATPFYLACPEAATRISQFNPQSRIIIMLRNPVDAMYSLHAEFVFAGSEQEAEFATALELEGARLSGTPQMTTSSPPFRHAYRWMTSFPNQVSRYLSVFPRDKVMFILQEEMNSNTAKIYKEVLDFLRVDPAFQPEFPRINANKRAKSKLLRQFLLHPPAWLRAAARGVVRDDRVQHAIRHKMRSLNRIINAKPTKRNAMLPDLRTQLVEAKREEIMALSEILSRDLSHWLR